MKVCNKVKKLWKNNKKLLQYIQNYVILVLLKDAMERRAGYNNT
jgi:hypothetical protein